MSAVPDDGRERWPRRRRVGFRLLVTIGWLLVIAAAFGFGYLLAEHDARVAVARIQSLQDEAVRLSEELAAARQANVRLERGHLMDRQAKRAARGELAELQRERLRLAQQVSYLRRLISADDRGIVEVKEVVLRPGNEPDHYRYRLTLRQLVPEPGRSEGWVTLQVAMSLDGEEVTRTLDDLPGSSPARLRMGFEHFQSLAGDIVLPAGAEPRQLIVDIEPSTPSLAASREAFLWLRPEVGDQRLPTAPSVDRAPSDATLE